jgi:hypothetical protein
MKIDQISCEYYAISIHYILSLFNFLQTVPTTWQFELVRWDDDDAIAHDHLRMRMIMHEYLDGNS